MLVKMGTAEPDGQQKVVAAKAFVDGLPGVQFSSKIRPR